MSSPPRRNARRDEESALLAVADSDQDNEPGKLWDHFELSKSQLYKAQFMFMQCFIPNYYQTCICQMLRVND